jgi:carboxyl-terminal processing protease
MVGITLTVARYYTPSGASIHGVGIQPDVLQTGDIILESERKEVHRLMTMKLLDDFTKDARAYTDESKRKFMDFLKSKNISLSERSAHFILKKEFERFSRPPLYDLEFDSQLLRAIAVFNERG